MTEELEKVKQEMEERGSSMTDGGKSLLQTHRYFVFFMLEQKPFLWPALFLLLCCKAMKFALF